MVVKKEPDFSNHLRGQKELQNLTKRAFDGNEADRTDLLPED